MCGRHDLVRAFIGSMEGVSVDPISFRFRSVMSFIGYGHKKRRAELVEPPQDLYTPGTTQDD